MKSGQVVHQYKEMIKKDFDNGWHLGYKQTCDPLGLWELLRVICLTASTNHNASDMFAACTRFSTCKQLEGERIPTFKKRFELCLKVLEEMEYPHIPYEDSIVMQLIEKF